jgi:hypothetical protein
MSVLLLREGDSADFSQGEVYFIGNATTLIRFGGVTVLTDPAFLHKHNTSIWATASGPSAWSSPPARWTTCRRSI